jgi:hypothetical protein
MPTARSISNHVDQVAEKARSEILPQIIKRLVTGGGALTMDFCTARAQLVIITCHTIAEESADDHSVFTLESDILELVSWDTTKPQNNKEIRAFLIDVLDELGLPASFFEQVHIVTDEGSAILNLNDNSLRCMAHVLSTVSKHITKLYKRDVTYPEELKPYADIFDTLISDNRRFLGSTR